MELTLKQEQKINGKGHLKLLLWLGIVGMIMLFAALTSAYIVMQGRAAWVRYDLPSTFWISTAVLLISSISMHRALSSARKGEQKNTGIALLLTLALGLLFTGLQFWGWSELYANNI